MNPPDSPPQTNNLDIETFRLFADQSGLIDETKRQARFAKIRKLLEFEKALSEMAWDLCSEKVHIDSTDPQDEFLSQELESEQFVTASLEQAIQQMEDCIVAPTDLEASIQERLQFPNVTS